MDETSLTYSISSIQYQICHNLDCLVGKKGLSKGRFTGSGLKLNGARLGSYDREKFSDPPVKKIGSDPITS